MLCGGRPILTDGLPFSVQDSDRRALKERFQPFKLNHIQKIPDGFFKCKFILEFSYLAEGGILRKRGEDLSNFD